MIDCSEKRNRQLAFELQNSHVCEKRSDGFLPDFVEIISCGYTKTIILFNLGE